MFSIQPDEPTAEALRHYYELVRKEREVNIRSRRASYTQAPYIDELAEHLDYEIDKAARRVIDALDSIPAVKALRDEVNSYPDTIDDEAVTDGRVDVVHRELARLRDEVNSYPDTIDDEAVTDDPRGHRA